MDLVERSALVAHGAATMYSLVENIESYPLFLPWCRATEVRLREPERTVATIHIDYRGVRQSFTTENAKEANASIAMRLVEGPFRKLEGLWQFHPLAADASKVELRLVYQLASPMLARLVGPVFEGIANSMVDAFVRRADMIHGRP
jgi:ribosome-associated toxin RatA of RatAB toxin-antitoxin module